jgi:two-component system, LytTR family, response regulator
MSVSAGASSEPIRTLVCDDEPDARKGLLALLSRDAQIAVVGEARNGREAATLIYEADPELVFLDIQMPELDGFGALAEVRRRGRVMDAPVVVFVTAYDEYALRAFEVHALDYLLKPFSDERFAEALRLAKARVRQRRAGELTQQLAALLDDAVPPAVDVTDTDRDEPSSSAHLHHGTVAAARYPDRIAVRTAKQVVFLPVGHIDWIEADDYYSKLHIGGRAYLIRETMGSLEARLDPTRFARVHRSAIVNLDRVQTLQPYFRGAHVLTLRDGTRLTLSRSRRESFERALGCRL